MAMTDHDIVFRFADIMGFGRLTHRLPAMTHYKSVLNWRAARFEHFQATIALLWPWLGVRRRARAKELLLLMRDQHAGQRKGVR